MTCARERKQTERYATAAEGLAKLKLKTVGVVLEPASDVSLVSLMPLARLTELENVGIGLLANSNLAVAPEEADALLSALCRVRRVTFYADAPVIASMQAACYRLSGSGVHLPQVILRGLSVRG
jgi:hypothetical protein